MGGGGGGGAEGDTRGEVFYQNVTNKLSPAEGQAVLVVRSSSTVVQTSGALYTKKYIVVEPSI